MKVAIEKTVGNSLLERRHDGVDALFFDHPANLLSRLEPEANRGHRPEQTITPDCESEQLTVLCAAAFDEVAAGIHEGERLHIAHERLHAKAAAMSVCRQASA